MSQGWKRHHQCLSLRAVRSSKGLARDRSQVKSDVGFDHMHKHGPGDDTEELPSLQKHVWRAVGVLQPPGRSSDSHPFLPHAFFPCKACLSRPASFERTMFLLPAGLCKALRKYALPLVTGVIVAMVWKNTAEDSYWTATARALCISEGRGHEMRARLSGVYRAFA